jgi:hypothetical protein
MLLVCTCLLMQLDPAGSTGTYTNLALHYGLPASCLHSTDQQTPNRLFLYLQTAGLRNQMQQQALASG